MTRWQLKKSLIVLHVATRLYFPILLVYFPDKFYPFFRLDFRSIWTCTYRRHIHVLSYIVFFEAYDVTYLFLFFCFFSMKLWKLKKTLIVLPAATRLYYPILPMCIFRINFNLFLLGLSDVMNLDLPAPYARTSAPNFHSWRLGT
jgi:hypothetical protein